MDSFTETAAVNKASINMIQVVSSKTLFWVQYHTSSDIQSIADITKEICPTNKNKTAYDIPYIR